jgi:hypothetical protein
MSTLSENSSKNMTNVSNQCPWLILPLELQEMILKYLDGKDLVRFTRTCRQFLHFDSDENLWKNLFFEKFGPNYRLIKPTNVDWKHWYFQNCMILTFEKMSKFSQLNEITVSFFSLKLSF